MKVWLPILLFAFAAACSDDTGTTNTGENNAVDMTTVEDMAADTNNGGADGGAMTDMAVEDMAPDTSVDDVGSDTGAPDMTDMAVEADMAPDMPDPGETVFLALNREDDPDELWLVEPSTGVETLVGSTGQDGLTRIFYVDSTQKLYAPKRATNELFEVDMCTGAATLLGTFTSLGDAILATDGWTYDPAGDIVYFGASVASPANEANTLFTLNLQTLEATQGPEVTMGFQNDMDMLGMVDGTLYVLDSNGNSQSQLHSVDTTTGVMTEIGNLSPQIVVSRGPLQDPDTGEVWVVEGQANVQMKRIATLDVTTGMNTQVSTVMNAYVSAEFATRDCTQN